MDPAKMKVVDLRSELGALGLDTKGNKPALVERLKKALESKTGKLLPDTSILDTSNEDVDEVSTPRKPGPAARTRRSSSTRLAHTPAKQPRLEEPPEVIEEDDDSPKSEPKTPSPVKAPEPVKAPQPVPAPVPEPVPEPVAAEPAKVADEDVYSVDDEKSQSPVEVKDDDDDQAETMDVQEKAEDGDKSPKKENEDADEEADEEKKDEDEDKERTPTEEEEWEQMSERLKLREEERIERLKQQAEADAQKIAEIRKEPMKWNRLKRKLEKKSRWNKYYSGAEVNYDVLTPPPEIEKPEKPKLVDKESVDAKIAEMENDDKVALSLYDSDLNQYINIPEKNCVMSLSDGAFSHAWAGTRATHGVSKGRVVYEVLLETIATTTEITEKDPITAGIRIGWSTEDAPLHLGEGELGWGYDCSGRAVNNGEFKDYGKEFTESAVIGAYLDLESSPCKILFTVDGVEQGTAFEFDKEILNGKPLFPHILTKNFCYRVNFGYDKYNLLSKTTMVRKREEIPVEQVLEEKKAREAEIQRQKDEAAKRAREKREQRERERLERQKKKKEEREKEEKERKEKEAKERKEKGEEEPMEEDKEEEEKEKETTEVEKEKEEEEAEGEEKEKEDEEDKEESEPKENGDKPEEEKEAEVEVKEEPMETDAAPAEDKEVKEEPADGDEVQEVTEEDFLNGKVLDKKVKFVVRYTSEEQLVGSEACLLPGYVPLSEAELHRGPRAPPELAHCEVILMVGLPGAGKTHWVNEHVAERPEKRYNVLSTAALLYKMKVWTRLKRTLHTPQVAG